MKTHWKETFRAVLLCTALASGCVLSAAAGETEESEKGGHRTEKTELTVFAAASMTETLTKLAETYEQEHPEITISFNMPLRIQIRTTTTSFWKVPGLTCLRTRLPLPFLTGIRRIFKASMIWHRV